jgi:hypothetical protein
MPLSREDLPRFAAAAVCRGSRKQEIVIDLIDAGVTQQAAQQMVEEIIAIHKELGTEEVSGLADKLYQTWLSRGTPLKFGPAKVPLDRGEFDEWLHRGTSHKLTPNAPRPALQESEPRPPLEAVTPSPPSALVLQTGQESRFAADQAHLDRAVGDRSSRSGGTVAVGALTITYGVVLCLFWGYLWASALSGNRSELLRVETTAGALALLLCALVPLMLVVSGAALCRARADNRRSAQVAVAVALVTAGFLIAKGAFVWYCLADDSPPSSSSSANPVAMAFDILGSLLRALAYLVVLAVVVVPSGVWAVVLAVTSVAEFGVRGRSRQGDASQNRSAGPQASR